MTKTRQQNPVKPLDRNPTTPGLAPRSGHPGKPSPLSQETVGAEAATV